MVVNWAPSPLGPERKVSEDLGIHCALKKKPLVVGDPILEYTHQDFSPVLHCNCTAITFFSSDLRERLGT